MEPKIKREDLETVFRGIVVHKRERCPRLREIVFWNMLSGFGRSGDSSLEMVKVMPGWTGLVPLLDDASIELYCL